MRTPSVLTTRVSVGLATRPTTKQDAVSHYAHARCLPIMLTCKGGSKGEGRARKWNFCNCIYGIENLLTICLFYAKKCTFTTWPTIFFQIPVLPTATPPMWRCYIRPCSHSSCAICCGFVRQHIESNHLSFELNGWSLKYRRILKFIFFRAPGVHHLYSNMGKGHAACRRTLAENVR